MTTEVVGAAYESFRTELVDAGLLLPTAVPGLYGRSEAFEDIVEAVDALISRVAPPTATKVRFPPVYPRASFERTDYIVSFPNLTGTVHSFDGTDSEHRALLAARSAGQQWDQWLHPGETCLVSAACHPVYETLPRDLSQAGVLFDVHGYCFRHEPSPDPLRMQAFRMREFVRVGTAVQATAHREEWIDTARNVLCTLDLEPKVVGANDPFFGRAGRMLAVNQRDAGLKTELVVDLYDGLNEGTALASCNYHEDHFGVGFGIRTPQGTDAHSSCVGFGLERIALALIRSRGLNTSRWIDDVRRLVPA
ncbi:amino acid--[acyl-carrier-protein] ligase [Skermania sp. ID1734]|uniref:amino acid--[acyl-carrier-protein] ligase n=1 Tax=Skermania sp. ID1734 TaxID=2597516 RepID=UPI002101FCEC|nr:amino acid--[acyl-carrier-protein] ligase [Skermania sp. ID1734]